MMTNAPEEENYYNSESEGKEYKINDEIFKRLRRKVRRLHPSNLRRNLRQRKLSRRNLQQRKEQPGRNLNLHLNKRNFHLSKCSPLNLFLSFRISRWKRHQNLSLPVRRTQNKIHRTIQVPQRIILP